MRSECFQLLDDEPIDNSFKKRNFLIIYHQQRADLNDCDQNVEFIFGEKKNYHQTDNAYLEFGITVRISAVDFDNISEIRIKSNASAYCFKEPFLSTTGGSDLEHNKYVVQISTIMRFFNE